MSIEMLNAVFGLGLRLPGGAQIVLLALADRTNGAGVCWPSIATIARMTGRSPRQVRRLLRWLERQGIVITTRSRGRRSSRYRIAIPNQDMDVRVGPEPSALANADAGVPQPGHERPPNHQG